ncbi:MAG: hypothetical protein ACJAZX_000448 [Rickettsiales bacterium]|jgi:hypothetical protein
MSIQLSNFLNEILPIFVAIFIAVFLSILLFRIIFKIFLIFARKKYQNLLNIIESKKPIKAEKVLPKEDSEKFVQKEGERELVEKIISKEQEIDDEEAQLGESKIVDLVKPVGFWTSMVLGQKLTYLVSSAKLMNENSDKGFWVSMVEAQGRAQGRQKGRGV